MEIFHGGWIPNESKSFENPGLFVFWIETANPTQSRKAKGTHPCHRLDLESFFSDELPLRKPLLAALQPRSAFIYLTLPSANDAPQPSPEMARLRGQLPAEDYTWQTWRVAALTLEQPLRFLKEIQFLSLYSSDRFELGSDLQFWNEYARVVRKMVLKHQYIPAIKCHQTSPKSAGRAAKERFYPGWEPLAPQYGQRIGEFARAMPLLCAAASSTKPRAQSELPSLCNAEALLRHFSEQMLESLVTQTSMTQKHHNQVKGSPLEYCLDPLLADSPLLTAEDWRQWQSWRQGLLGDEQQAGFRLGLRLLSAQQETPDTWGLEFLV